MTDALIGYSGFVGGILSNQHSFPARFNSRTIGDAAGQSFGTVVCAAAPGSMFEANNFPDRDRAKMDGLMAQLDAFQAERFVLISSIAVLDDFAGAYDEDTAVYQEDLAYGRNRRALETFCEERFDNSLIVRLPALFGPGLRKNFIFDLLNPMPTMLKPDLFDALLDELGDAEAAALKASYALDDGVNMQKIDRAILAAHPAGAALEAAMTERGKTAPDMFHNPKTTYQYYNMARLWDDVTKASQAGLKTVHLSAEPIEVATIYKTLTGRDMADNNARLHGEDMRSRHGQAMRGHSGPYLDPADQVLTDLTAFYGAAREET